MQVIRVPEKETKEGRAKRLFKKKKLAEKDFEGLNNFYFQETAIVTMFTAQ